MLLATYYELLKEYVSFKTVHDTTTFSFEAEKAIKRLTHLFVKHQFEVKEYSIDDIPLLLAKHIQNKNLPTALIYTHYDLHLLDISPDWKNNPYNLYLGKEEIIGRGVAENKGQFMMYLTSILHLLQNDSLGYNVIFLIDGTQHKVWTNLNDFLTTHGIEVQSDFCFCSIGSSVGISPMLAIGQRGMLNFDITLSHTTSLQQGETKSSNTSTLNPLLEMSKLLSKLYNLDKIYIPYFYYNVEKAKQETEIRRYGTNLEYKTITRSTHKNHTILTPTLDITGIISFPKFEKSTTIPKKVIANLEMHLVPHQRYAEIINGLQQWLKLIVPQQLKAELLVHEACNPCKFELQNPYTQKAITLLSGLLKTPLEYQQNLYGLKAVEQLQKSVCPILISLPFASEESGIGRANEHLTTETVKKALDFCMAFFGK